MAIITISRECGARGNIIARRLADRLGYRYANRDVLHEVSLEYGVKEEEFEHIYEQAPGLLERYDKRNREIVRLFDRIIRGLAQRDNLVMVGRGAFVVLHTYGDALNVRVTAKRSVRIQRIQQDEGVSVKKAKSRIKRIDKERRKYIGAHYGLDWSDAGLYDLCVNTTKLDIDSAVDLILQALADLERDRSPDLPLVTAEKVDPTLQAAIDAALNLLDAVAQTT
ncbi:MAG TPA: cytidylate kinase-like family protein [Caldilineae bacterium]|nr:cytidylate kinase-like family protein [Caldilineae bacterium]